MSPSERHNRLVSDTVMRIGAETDSIGELMAALESIILAAMLIAQRVHGVTPAGGGVLTEAAVQRATERFAGKARGSAQ